MYEYYVEHTDVDASAVGRVRCQPGYFSVDPLLTLPARSSILSPDYSILPVGSGGTVSKTTTVNLPLDGLVIQSVIAKWMGAFSEWQPHLDLMRDRGYNAIHYTPLQQRGESGSPYSIFDQLAFADDLFDKGTKEEDKVATLRSWLARIKSEWGMLGLIDVVLNHTANNSVWLEDHPESGEFNSNIHRDSSTDAVMQGTTSSTPLTSSRPSSSTTHSSTSPPRSRLSDSPRLSRPPPTSTSSCPTSPTPSSPPSSSTNTT